MTTTRLLSALTVCASLLPASPAADPGDGAKLLADLTARHREALEAIRTVSFAFERAELKVEPLTFRPPDVVSVPAGGIPNYETGPGRYWQTPERWRSSAGWSDGTTVDEVYRHHTLLIRRSAPSHDPARPTELTRENVTPWARNGRDRLAALLFGHTARDTFAAIPFHHLLEQPHKLLAVERLPDGDVRVELSHSDGRYEFWFSPKYNHLIRKRVSYPADEPDHRHEVEVTHFSEPNRGQFFPTTVEYRSFEKGELKQHGRMTLSEVLVNRPIANEVFRIPDIAWMVCKDLTRQRSYQVDAEGYRVGAVLGADQESGRGMIAPPRPTPAMPPAAAESDGPVPWWVWAVIASLVLCLVAAVMEIHRLRTPPPPPVR